MTLTSIRLYNLRKFVRARVSQNDPLSCLVMCPYTNRKLNGSILDVGEGGAGVVAVDDSQQLENGQRVILRFTLPDTQRVVRIESAVRHARTEDGRVVFGVEFGEGRSPSFVRLQLERLRAFIRSLFLTMGRLPQSRRSESNLPPPEDPATPKS